MPSYFDSKFPCSSMKASLLPGSLRVAFVVCTCLLSSIGALSGKAQQNPQLTPVDKESKVVFSIRNFGMRTNGNFSGLGGLISFDPRFPARSKMDVTINSASVNTGNKTRDKHLRQDDYFDVEKFPKIRLQSTLIQATTTPSQYLFKGILTIKDVSKTVKFTFSSAVAPGGFMLVSEKLRINRRDFKVGGSSISLSDDVDVTISVYAKQ